MSSLLPSRFLRIASAQNPLVKRLALLRTSKLARQEQGHVLVQGIKTLEEISSKPHHRIRTIGITFDENALPIRSPALDIVSSVRQQEREQNQEQAQEQHEYNRHGHDQKKKPRTQRALPRRQYQFEADQFVAMSRKMTSRILGTDSLTSDHEVWAEVAIPNHDALFSPPASSDSDRLLNNSQKEIHRLLVLDQLSDPGNMGLIIRSAKALSWDAAWHTPGTVDLYNDKVVRASRALCLDWPTHIGGWTELGRFLEREGFVLLVADMVPEAISSFPRPPPTAVTATGTEAAGSEAGSVRSGKALDLYNLVWWNWPSSLPRTRLPAKLALLMGSEHHGVNAATTKQASKKVHSSRHGSVMDDTDGSSIEQELREEHDAKARLMRDAIRVSIPMNSAVESMNVAGAATAMMWELNRLLSESNSDRATTLNLQIIDAPISE